MSRVTLRSGAVRDSGYAEHPAYSVSWQRCPKRVRAVFNEVTVADSLDTQYLFETRHLPVYYFPAADVAWEHFHPSETSTFCPFKGEAHYWSLRVGERTVHDAMWAYPDPFAEVSGLEAFVALYWTKMDAWLEEDEEVLVHPRDPRVRIDVLASRRPVKVTLAGQIVADSRSALFLFETGLPTRYYLPAGDVRTDLLTPSDTVTACPYKGRAVHFSAAAGDAVHEDVAWSYPQPVAEVGRIKDYVCFYTERVDGIEVDGVPVPSPRTRWSR